MTNILTPISPGELLDKITILEIKLENITDTGKLQNVQTEYTALQEIVDNHIPDTPKLHSLVVELRHVNQQLWNIEDDIRDCERGKEFGANFIHLARAVYNTNDKRADLKKQINLLLGSQLIEEKSYSDY